MSFLSHGAWAQAPGCAHLVLGGGGSGCQPFQSSSEMNNLGRPLSQHCHTT